VSDEEQELHASHDWYEHRVLGTLIWSCSDCKVDGYENEPKAFKRCPGSQRTPCPVTMWAVDDPGHLHRCLGGHTEGDHFCKECHRWYNVVSGSPLEGP
jgi:hypothetical protein